MSLTELAKGLEAAVQKVESSKAAAAAAEKAHNDAKAAYVSSVEAVRSLHAEYQKIMNDILSFGGTVHVAK